MDEQSDRRKFLARLSIGMGALGAAIVGVPVAGFLLAPLFKVVERVWRDLGPVNQYTPGQTVEVRFEDASNVAWAGVAGRTGAWLRCQPNGQFVAFAINCTHLGCPVRWLPDADLFMCPCHGGVYYSDGTVAAGPPPRPLVQYPVRVHNGQVQILTTPTPIT